MFAQQRPFTANDLPAMRQLARELADQHLRNTDLPYRLSSWAIQEPQNLAVWVDDDQKLIGWAALQKPFWTIDFTCPAWLDAQVLQWADERARAMKHSAWELPCWFVMTFADQQSRIQELEAAGFANQADCGEDSWSKVWMERPADRPIASYRIPAGFQVRPLRGEQEAATYVELHQAVFGTKNMTLDWRLRTLQQPGYEPELDLVVEAPDGRLAAFCVGWLNGNSLGQSIGQIEPLGCHADFRQYGLGRVVLAEVLRRMQALGVAKVYVETDNYRDTAFRLYEHSGFQTIRPVLVFRKDYA